MHHGKYHEHMIKYAEICLYQLLAISVCGLENLTLLVGKSAKTPWTDWVIFHSYVKLPNGNQRELT